MEFGYFTLSENNTRTSNQLVSDITDQALHADKIGMHSAWIGEHHFNSLGILSCPEIVLSNIASRTRNIRLAPADATTASFRFGDALAKLLPAWRNQIMNRRKLLQ